MLCPMGPAFLCAMTTGRAEGPFALRPLWGSKRGQISILTPEPRSELEMPALILPSVQVNIRAGYLPEPESNGTSYLKIPLNVL